MSKKPFGVLMLHGWTASPKNFGFTSRALETLGIPFLIPTLKGHGAESPEALRDVKWQEWLEDGRSALLSLAKEVEKVILVGHSMGSMIALDLAAEHPDLVDSLIVAAPAVQVESPFGPGRPLNFLVPLLVIISRNRDLVPDYSDKQLEKFHPNYRWVPTTAVKSLFDLIKYSRTRLSKVTSPILILHSRKDNASSPDGIQTLYDTVSTPKDDKRVLWFEKTNHEMFLDCEREAVIQAVVNYIRERTGSE